jgi:hypothetical protein
MSKQRCDRTPWTFVLSGEAARSRDDCLKCRGNSLQRNVVQLVTDESAVIRPEQLGGSICNLAQMGNRSRLIGLSWTVVCVKANLPISIRDRLHPA